MTVSENKANRFEQLPDIEQVLPEQCLSCGCEDGYVATITNETLEFRGEKFKVEYERMQCPKCGDAMLSDEQATNRIKSTVEAYQRKHEMLTAREIISRRKALGCSQRQLVGLAPDISIATLKRIEAGLNAQNKSTDVLIRVALSQLEIRKRMERYWAISKEEPTEVIAEKFVFLHRSHRSDSAQIVAGFEDCGIAFEGFSTRITSTIKTPARIDLISRARSASIDKYPLYCEDIPAGEEQFAMAV